MSIRFKNFKKSFLFLKVLVLGFCLVLFAGCSTTLDPIEIESLRQGKRFWSWDSPNGKFNIHYIEKGSGNQHVVLLHGFGAHIYTWRFIIDSLVDRGYHVWALDLLGFGLSDKPSQVSYQLDFFTDQIQAFMQAQNIAKAHLIGNSMGGGLALGMAIANPNQVRSLILIDALGYPLELPWLLTIPKTLGVVAKPLLEKTAVKQLLEEVIYNDAIITEEQIQAYALPLYLPGGKDALIATLKKFDNKQLDKLSKQFKNLSLPILIIWGDKDNWIPIQYYERFKQDFPQAQTVLIPNCGHIPQEECPKEVESAILQFLGSPYST